MKPGRADYPQPVLDADNEPYILAWRAGELHLQHCNGCGAKISYPRPVCPQCWSSDLQWQRASGTGEIMSFTRIYRPNHHAFNEEVPVILAEIRLAEQVALLARIICDSDAAREAVRTGAHVELYPDGWKERNLPLPAFKLRDG